MTPNPEIAAMLALKRDVPAWSPYANTGLIREAEVHNAAIDACIATLSNHVFIPEGEFAGIVEVLRFYNRSYGDLDAQKVLDLIDQKYAGEGKNE